MTRVALIAVLLISASAAQAEEKRQLGAHEHGHGALNIAIEGKRVSMELRIPGSDIVGFERTAQSDKEKAAIAAAKDRLWKPLSLFVPDGAAQCKVAEADVAFEADGTSEEAHKDGDTHAHGDKHAHGEKNGEAQHAEFHATYQLACADVAKLSQLTLAFFDAFPRSKELDVRVLGPKGQTKHDATRASPVISLAGIQ